MDKLKEKIKNLVEKVKGVFNRKKKEAEKKLKRQRLIMILTVFFVCVVFLLLLITPIVAYEYLYNDKIFAGVYVDGINLGGLTETEAINKLNQHIDNIKLKGLSFNYNNNRYIIEMTVLSPEDPDLAFPILNFETEKMVDQAFAFGRNKDFLTNLYDQAKALMDQKKIAVQYNLNEKELLDILQERYSPLEEPAVNAQIVFTGQEYKIMPEKDGFVIDYDQAINRLKSQINLIDIQTINLQKIQSNAGVTRVEAMRYEPALDKVLQIKKFSLIYEDQVWEIKTEEFKKWLSFDRGKDSKVIVVFDQELIGKKLNKLAEEINIEAENAKFTFSEDKVKEFDAHKNGLAVDIGKSTDKINQEFFHDPPNREIDLVVNKIEPKIKTADVNDMGITEIVGVGESDFVGSSSNRIGNIRNASNILHGMLIKPGEEFSLVEAIGEVNAATGFFPEYVIKGDRTIKEYGGGLCQIATTTFRAAINTGLPITERKPHSYIVSYYNPIGFDAAIYGPHPDVRFINDTDNYILFQTEIDGTHLKFTFWGKSDGRIVEVTEPEVYNWRGPPAAKYIENPNLEPGTKKLIEYSKSGADAHFYRYITRPGQEKEEEIWRSHYVAWPAIYEVGLEPASETDNGSEANKDNGENEQADESVPPSVEETELNNNTEE